MYKYLLQFISVICVSLIILVIMTGTTYIEETPVSLPEKVKSDAAVEATQNLETVANSAPEDEALVAVPSSSEGDNLTQSFEQISRSPYRDLLNRNKDYRGWITVNGTDISYPIVKGEDNDYYLKRSFDRNYDEKGTVYMDYRNLGFGFTQHIILYGHNMKDGSMFGDLKKYKDESFALDNRIIEIEDLYGTRYYKIYASYYAAADSSLITTDFLDVMAYQTFIDGQILQSDVNYGLQPDENSHILTLVTCSYEVDDGRYLVHAVEVDRPTVD